MATQTEYLEATRPTQLFTVPSMAAAGVLLLLVVIPYRNGIILPWTKLIATLCILALGFICMLFYRDDRIDLPRPDRYILLVMGVAYGLPIFFSCNVHEAIKGFLWVAASLVVYLLAAVASRKSWFRAAVTNIWIANSGVLSLFGLLVAGRLIQIPQYIDNNVVSSSFGYANAFAIYILTASLIAFGEWEARSQVFSPYYSTVIYLNTICLNASGSRLSWLILPIAVLGYFASTRRSGLNLKIGLLGILGIGLVVGSQIGPLVGSKQLATNDFWIPVFLGFFAAVAFGLLPTIAATLQRRLSGRAKRWLTVVSSLVVISLLVGGALMIFNTRVGLELRALSLEDRYNVRRIFMLKDAGRLFLHSPLGQGSGSWLCQYQQSASYGYIVNDPHSHIALMAVEAGILALVSYVMLWFLFLRRSVKALRRSSKHERAQWAALIWALLALGVHSTIDVDLSFGAVLFTLMAVFGASAGTTAACEPASGAKFRVVRWGLTGMMLIFTLVASSFAMSQRLSQSARKAYGSQEYTQCLNLWRSALRASPYDPQVLEELGRLELWLGQNKGDHELIHQGSARLKRAVFLMPSNFDLWTFYTEQLIGLHREGEADDQIEAMITQRPWRISSYEGAARLRLMLAESYNNQAKNDLARVEARKILRLLDRIALQRSKAPVDVPEDENLPLTSEALVKYRDKAQAILNNSSIPGD